MKNDRYLYRAKRTDNGEWAECYGYPDMPIGDLHDYALKRGNIFENPELLEVGE